MKNIFWIIIVLVIIAGGYELIAKRTASQTTSRDTASAQNVIVKNLNIPWDIATLPDDSLLITEREGNLVRIYENQERVSIPFEISSVGEGGLLGLTLHPNFETNNYVYLYITQKKGGGLMNSVKRYMLDLESNVLQREITIVDNIPGAPYHDGGRLRFGPDGLLYITTGDAGDEDSAQDKTLLSGKILRVTDDGSIPTNNPFGNAVWSYGHRNPQGIAWDNEGRLWSTEHGRSGILSGYDELNLIERGGNYGWPVIQGDETKTGMIAPVLHSGSDITWAPASLEYHDNHLYWGGLRGESVYRVEIVNDAVENLEEYFVGELGRIRTVVKNLDRGIFYISTSNTDGRGTAGSEDDRILGVPFSFFENTLGDSDSALSEDSDAPLGQGVDENIEETVVNNFRETLQQKVVSELGQPIEGFEPSMFLRVYPGLVQRDFDGVDAMIGAYRYQNNELVYDLQGEREMHSAARAISGEGMSTLYENVTDRLRFDANTQSVENLLTQLSS